MCQEGHCPTVGFPQSPSLYLAMRKHQITQPGVRHPRKYLTSALHEGQHYEKQGKAKELSLLEENKGDKTIKCNVGSWIRFWN